MRTFKTEAIVLKKKNLLGKDNVISLFTEAQGKLSVFAKGIKKITSKRLSDSETGNLIKVIIYRSHDRFYLQDTRLISLFSQIKKSRQKVSYLYFFLYLLDRLLPENQKEEAAYLSTKKFLIMLSKKNLSEEDLIHHINILLGLLGYDSKSETLSQLSDTIQSITNEKLPFFTV